MPETNTPQPKSELEKAALELGMPERSERQRAEELKQFDKELLQDAGLVPVEDLNDISDRSAERAKNRPSRAALVAGGVATGAVLTVAAMNGMFNEADDAKRLADYDAKNKAANIANNPELFGGELPANPSDMTVVVTPEAETTSQETDVSLLPEPQIHEREQGS